MNFLGGFHEVKQKYLAHFVSINHFKLGSLKAQIRKMLSFAKLSDMTSSIQDKNF